MLLSLSIPLLSFELLDEEDEPNIERPSSNHQWGANIENNIIVDQIVPVALHDVLSQDDENFNVAASCM